MLLKRIAVSVPKLIRRNLGIIAPLQQSTDLIQKLFIDKIREYKSKGPKMSSSPEIEKELKAELERLSKQYGGTTADMTNFPKFNFPEPTVEQQVSSTK